MARTKAVSRKEYENRGMKQYTVPKQISKGKTLPTENKKSKTKIKSKFVGITAANVSKRKFQR